MESVPAPSPGASEVPSEVPSAPSTEELAALEEELATLEADLGALEDATDSGAGD
ncbi:MAG: hypothetical protein WCI50_00130 [Actinomycetes bacterium]